jgi:hypothetical protein
MEQKVMVALSERDGEEAIRDVSLTIKSVFTKSIKTILIFFTPHYQPAALLKMLDFTLKPQLVVGLLSPFLIFEDKIIDKGVVGCCLNNEGIELKDFFIKTDEPEQIESALRIFLKGFPGEKQFLLSFIPYQFNPAVGYDTRQVKRLA